VDSATVTLGTDRLPAGLLKRVATAAVLVPLFVWLVSRGPGWLFVLLVVAVGAAATWELMRMFEPTAGTAYGWLAVVAASAVAASFATPITFVVPAFPTITLTVAVGALLTAPVWLGGRPAVQPVTLAVLGVLYVGWFLGHAILLHAFVTGPDLVLFLVGVTWVGESAAYAVGATLGRHKLAPAISPNKTIEGSLAQLVASLVAALVLGGWLLPGWSAARALVAGGMLGVVGQLGDLAESVMKRSAGVKDTSGLIPGHGGMLDRLDSLLFNTPAFYYYVALGGVL
jgi:phosphatidate cytidylyltransferase